MRKEDIFNEITIKCSYKTAMSDLKKEILQKEQSWDYEYRKSGSLNTV